MGSPAFLDINTGKVSTSGTHPVVFIEDGWTSVICDLREWMIKDPRDAVPPAFIKHTDVKLDFLGDQKDAEKWANRFEDALDNISCDYFVISQSGNMLSVILNNSATPCSATQVILTSGGDAAARNACYGDIMGGKRIEGGDWNEKQKGGGGGGGGGSGGPPSPSPPSLGGSPSGQGSGSGSGSGSGQGGDTGGTGSGMSGGQGDGSGSGQGQGSGQGAGGDGSGEGGQGSESGSGECGSCGGSGMSGGQGDSGDGDGSGQGDGGEGQGQGQGDESGDQEGVCGDCGGTGEETPVNAAPADQTMSDVQEKAAQQAQKDFDAQQEERSEKCQAAADEAEQQADAGNPQEATDAACDAKECGNPNSQKDKDNMARAEEAANKAIDDAEDNGSLSSEQAQELRDQLSDSEPSNQSEAQKMASEARQMAQDAQMNQDPEGLKDAADKLHEAAEEANNSSDNASVSQAAQDVADIAGNMGDEDIQDDLQELADELSQKSGERKWGIKEEDSGEFLTDEHGKPLEFDSQEEAQEMIDDSGEDGLTCEPLPNRLDTAFNEANDDGSMDPNDPETRNEFDEQYDKTMDELAEGQICTVVNLDGVFTSAHEVYEELLNYAYLFNPMLHSMMSQAKQVPVKIAVQRERTPIHLEVLNFEDLDEDQIKNLIDNYLDNEDYTDISIHSMDEGDTQNGNPDGWLPKWAALTWSLPGTLADSFGINSQVRVIEELGDWVKVRPLGNLSGYMALLKSNLDCYAEPPAEPGEMEDLLDLPSMPTTTEELKKILEEARLKKQRKMRQTQEVSSDAMVDWRVNILTGERKSFTKDQLLAGEGGRGWVSISMIDGVYSDLIGLCELLDLNNISYTVVSQTVGPTKIQTDASGLSMATKLGKPLTIRNDTVGYL